MRYLLLPGNRPIPLLTDAERVTWEGENPKQNELIFNEDTSSFWYFDDDLGIAIDLGTTTGGLTKVLNTTAPSSGTTYTIAGLIGATVKAIDRGGIGIEVVTDSAVNQKVYFDTTTGDLELGPDDAWGGEWLRIWYSGVPEIGS